MSEVTYDFDDETVVVTGGSSGIGRELSLRFGAAGATVLVADIREESNIPEERPTHEHIEDDGGTAVYVETDVADPNQIASVVEAARDFGGVDVMVNNAGIIDRVGLLEATPASFDRIQAVNSRGVLFGCQAAAEDMIERDDPGVILNLASINSEFALRDHILYDASKGAVKMITRGAALELAEYDIRVNGLAPGYIATNVSEGGPEGIREAVATEETLKFVPMGRAGETPEAAAAGVFLCTDAASYVTGEVFHVDGGYQTI